MSKRVVIILLALIALIALGALAWYLASPLFINRTVEEALPLEIPGEAEMEAMPEAEREALAGDLLGTAAAMPDKPMEEPMPSEGEPISLRSGVIRGADRFHQGEGVATIFELPDGSRILRLADFMVTNGPDLHVLLASGSMPLDQAALGDYLDLGELKGNLGNQNYEIPSTADLDQYSSVVIYCLPFHVVFAYAELTNP